MGDTSGFSGDSEPLHTHCEEKRNLGIWSGSKLQQQRNIRQHDDSGDGCLPFQVRIKKFNKKIDLSGEGEANEQQARQIQKPQILLPNTGTAISEQN